MERLVGSIRASLEEGKPPRVPEERSVEQSLFPARLHPKCALLDEQLLTAWEQVYGSAWAADLRQMHTNDIASLAGFFWPNSSSDSRTITLDKLMQWFTLVDDAVDDLNAPLADKLCHRLIHHIFSSPSPPNDQKMLLDPPLAHEKEPLIISIGLEWWNEVKGTTSPAQGARIAAEFRRYLLNQVGFIRCREKPALQVGLEEYIQIRRASSGFPACISMTEYDVGVELDEETLKNPVLKQLQVAACDHTACINDILSFPKEFASGDLLNLLPLLHMRNNEGKTEKEELVPFKEAVSEAWRMVQARERDVARLARSLRGSASWKNEARLETYVESVCSLGSGMWAWMVQTPRYIVPASLNKLHKPLAYYNRPVSVSSYTLFPCY